MRRTAVTLTTLSAALLPLVLGGPAQALPSCTGSVPTAVCGGRVVAEPELSTTFLQYDGPGESLAASLTAIEALSPRFVEVGPIGEFLPGSPATKSAGGRDLWVARITDETVPREGKRQVAASLSVHGQESAGREGGIRYVEDLARWSADYAAGKGDHLMYAGDTAEPVSKVLAGTESWFAFLNPDGWASGDLGSSGVVPARANDDGADLNRDYPTVGWMDRSGGRGVAVDEPETRAWVDLVESFPHLTTSTDIHGELTTPNDAFSDLIVPAGQWTPKRQEQVDQLGRAMIGTVERKFDEYGVVLDQLLAPLPSDGTTPRKPANIAAAYDIVGYDDSGFMGDWFSQRQDSVHMDVENFLSHTVPGNAWVGGYEKAHVTAVRGLLEAVVVEALHTEQVRPVLGARRFAYVADPTTTSSTDADGWGDGGEPVDGEEGAEGYDVTRLRYLQDVGDAAQGAVAVPADDLAAGTADLSGIDTLVVADLAGVPAGSTAAESAYVAALREFAQGGGQVLLTDRALALAPALTGVAGAVDTTTTSNAGHVQFLAPVGDDPLEQGLTGKPSQTYYEVMLGYPAEGSAPNHGVDRAAWEAAGGRTVATTDEGRTALGSLPVGEGRVTVFGSVLPQAVEDAPHPFGLADYAVTITGGQVLDNVLAYDRSAPAPSVATARTEPASPSLLDRVAGLWQRVTGR